MEIGNTYPKMFLAVRHPIHLCCVSPIRALGPRLLSAFGGKCSLLLTCCGSNHAQTTVGSSDKSAVMIFIGGCCGRSRFHVLISGGTILDGELTGLSFFGSGIIVEILTVVFGQGAVSDTASGRKMQFVIGVVERLWASIRLLVVSGGD